MDLNRYKKNLPKRREAGTWLKPRRYEKEIYLLERLALETCFQKCFAVSGLFIEKQWRLFFTSRPMHSDHPKSHLGSGRHGGDEDAGISAIYHSREYGLESSSGWHRCSGRRCMGAGGRICEAICGCGFPYFNGGNRMLSGIPFI